MICMIFKINKKLNRQVKQVLILVLFIIMLLSTNIVSYAYYTPYSSYTYNFWEEQVPAPDSYVPVQSLSGRELGVGQLDGPRDIFVSADSQIFLVDSGNNRIIQIDENWEVTRIIESFTREGHKETFDNPQGVFVRDNGDIFIADTDNNRIVILNYQGEYIREIKNPEEDEAGLVSDDFRFAPRDMVVDSADRIFVLGRGIYDGLMLFDENGQFRGFVGAPPVTPSAADLFWRTFSTEEQRRRQQLFLPTVYTGINLGKEGFVYATVRGTDNPIRRLNPSGVDVLRREGFIEPAGDPEGARPWHRPDVDLVDIVSHENGIYSALDQSYGRVFTYDRNGNLLYVFGGRGTQKGSFRVAAALAKFNNKLIVLDSYLNRLTVFRPTKYASQIHQAIDFYDQGFAVRAKETWEKVLKLNSNFDMAYTGIGKNLLFQEEYESAMENFKLGQNRQYYSVAFQYYRRNLLDDNFTRIILILLGIVFFILLLRRFKLFIRLRNVILGPEAVKKLETGEVSGTVEYIQKETGMFLKVLLALKYSFYLIFHPADGFWDIKHEKRANLPAAVIILILVSVSYIFVRQYTGFIFNPLNLNQLNIYSEMATILIPFLLWCGVNWAFTTLMEGKGSFTDILIASSYALTPLFIINIPMTLISNYLTQQEGNFYYFFISMAVLWAGILLFLGTMITHEYEVGKTVFTIILIIAGMVLLSFLGLLFFVLFDQLVAFINDIYTEITFRI